MTTLNKILAIPLLVLFSLVMLAFLVLAGLTFIGEISVTIFSLGW